MPRSRQISLTVGGGVSTPDPGFVSGWGNPTWRDEFDGAANSKPDTTKWSDRYAAGQFINTDAQGWLDPANTYLDGNGHLVLQSSNTAPPAGSAAATAGRTWSTAYLWTNGKFDGGWGRWEIRYRSLEPLHSRGIWFTPWLRATGAQGEIDTSESMGTPANTPSTFPNNGSGSTSTMWKVTGSGTIGLDRTGPGDGTGFNNAWSYALETQNDASIGQVAGSYWGWHTAVCILLPNRVAIYSDTVKKQEVLAGTTLGNNILAGFPLGKADMRLTVHVGDGDTPANSDTTGYGGNANTTDTRSPHLTLVDHVRFWGYDGSQT